MEKDYLAIAKFTATAGVEHYEIVLKLVQYGGFDYGNRHGLIYDAYENGKLMRTDYFDARYDHRFNSEKAFKENALAFVKGQLRDDLVVEQIN